MRINVGAALQTFGVVLLIIALMIVVTVWKVAALIFLFAMASVFIAGFIYLIYDIFDQR